MDSLGNVKVTSAASGLTDPVTVPHGGTGLTSYTKGDFPYASAANTMSKLAIDTADYRVLTNGGAATFDVPKWDSPYTALSVLPKPTNRKFAFLTENIGSGTVMSNIVWGTPTNGTAPSAVVDATTAWVRHTSSSDGSLQGVRITNNWCWIDNLPRCEAYIRTGSDITNIRINFYVSNAAAFISNADNQAALKGVGIRYSSAADSGNWVGWTSDGTTQTTSSAIAAIAASTVYKLTINVTATNSVSLSVNDGTAQTLTIGAGALGTAMLMQCQVIRVSTANKTLDISAIYGEWN